MILRELVVHNVGVFLGRHSINLSTSDGKPIVLVGGMNGRGKTTILDSLQLAMFGRRAGAVRRSPLAYEEYLARLVHHDAKPAEASVSLRFAIIEDGQELEYKIHRVWARRSGEGAKEIVSVWVNGAPDKVSTERWADIAEGLLPVEIAELFFFDGEKIEQLADPTSAARVIESAVHGLLGVGVVERLERDLTSLQRRWRVEETDSTAQDRVKELQTRIEELATQRESVEQERAAAQNRVDTARRALADASHQFTQGGGDLAAQRDILQHEHDHVRASLARVKRELIDLAGGALPLSLVAPLLQRSRETARSDQAAIDSDALASVLELRDESVLEALRAKSLGKDVIHTVADLLSHDRAARRVEHREPLLGIGLEGMGRFALAHAALESEAPAVRRLLSELELLHSSLGTIEKRLEAVPPDPVVQRLKTRVEACEKALIVSEASLSEREDQLTDVDRQRADAELKLERFLERYASDVIAAEDRVRMERHADRAGVTLKEFRKRMISRQLAVIEASVLRSFQQLVGKASLIGGLSISADAFTVTLFSHAGDELTPERLSAGERQLLATALLWGLARASGRRLPMVIDTPLGRLDSEHRRNLVERYFPAAAEQMVLLSTDEEIDEELQRSLLPYISQQYLLRYDDSKRATSIEQGYFWEGSNVA